jgi:hypothetical protein
MHRLSLLALALALSLLPLARATAAPAAAQVARPPSAIEAALVRQAKYECGTFDGHFTCRSVPGEAGPGGKSAIPRITEPPSSGEAPAPIPGEPGATAPGAGGASATGCQHGMVGTPPDCRCPESSELLGGNCVHYTARCTNALAAGAVPQPCPGPEEKLSCKMRQDGLKDCCCITYDKW